MVIQYNYKINKSPLLLSFGLGDSISLSSVLGLPTIVLIGAIIYMKNDILCCTDIPKLFPLTLSQSGIGLPSYTEVEDITSNIKYFHSINISSIQFYIPYTTYNIFVPYS